jgi:hypothetical protein
LLPAFIERMYSLLEDYDAVVPEDAERCYPLAAVYRPQVRAVANLQSAGPGFCLGPVVIDTDNDYELAAFRFRDGSRAHRDVSLQVDLSTFKRDESEPRLVQRVDSSLSAFGFGPKVFRKGAVQLAGMPGEEWLSAGFGLVDGGKDDAGNDEIDHPGNEPGNRKLQSDRIDHEAVEGHGH